MRYAEDLDAPIVFDTPIVEVLPTGGTVVVQAVTREGSLAEISGVGMLRVRTPQGYPGAAPIELVERMIAAYRAATTPEVCDED
jgi:hypothetical protein